MCRLTGVTLKNTQMHTFQVQLKFSYLEIETDEGITELKEMFNGKRLIVYCKLGSVLQKL
jgi:hypothetical protein